MESPYSSMLKVNTAALSAACLGLMFWCGGATVAAQSIEVEDDAGRIVRLPAAAQRIVSLAPHLSELVYFAGALPKLVGVSVHCDYPAAVQTLDRVADSRSIDYERIMRLRPDLILAWRAGINAVQLEKLTRLFKHVYVSDPNDFHAIADNLMDVGQLAGSATHADQAAWNFLLDIDRLRTTSNNRYRALYLITAQPAITINREHWISKTMALCGADNVFKQARNQVVWLSREALLLEPIDVVIHSMDDDAAVAALWPATTIVRLQADTIQRPTPRLLDAATDLCRQLF